MNGMNSEKSGIIPTICIAISFHSIQTTRPIKLFEDLANILLRIELQSYKVWRCASDTNNSNTPNILGGFRNFRINIIQYDVLENF